jgi:hypothetical protein
VASRFVTEVSTPGHLLADMTIHLPTLSFLLDTKVSSAYWLPQFWIESTPIGVEKA